MGNPCGHVQVYRRQRKGVENYLGGLGPKRVEKGRGGGLKES